MTAFFIMIATCILIFSINIKRLAKKRQDPIFIVGDYLVMKNRPQSTINIVKVIGVGSHSYKLEFATGRQILEQFWLVHAMFDKVDV